jgi:hypothetical protein
MYRIFKRNMIAPRGVESRTRRPPAAARPRGLEGRQLMSLGLNDFLVNVNTSGSQFSRTPPARPTRTWPSGTPTALATSTFTPSCTARQASE